ncbi:MAG: hypothetical protein K8T20_14835 [Planctomycetes bacterium]|nr:hypothetical protein [Planctomycetota bacterium]
MPSFAAFWQRATPDPRLPERLAGRLARRTGDAPRVAAPPDGVAGLVSRFPENVTFAQNASGTVRCAFDGELFNKPDIRKFVVSRTRNLKDESPAELIANLWEAKGRDMMMSLRGSFAFALWDEPNRILFVARDAMGHRPLYMVEGPAGWGFASELPPLLAFTPTRPGLDPKALDFYLAFHTAPAPLTLFKGIRKLPPAGWMEIHDGHAQEGRYWTPTYYDTAGQNPDEIAQHAFSYLFESVKAHTRDLDMPSVLLEGDPFSTILAGLAGLAKRGKMKTFTIRHGWVPPEAREGAELGARRFGTPLEEEESADSISGLLEATARANVDALPLSRMAPAMLFARSRGAAAGSALTAAGGELYMLAGKRAAPTPMSTLGMWRRMKDHADAAGKPVSKELATEFESRMVFPPLDRAQLGRQPGIPAMDSLAELFRGAPTPGDTSIAAYVDAVFFLPELFLAPLEAACRSCDVRFRSPLADPSAVQILVPVVHALAGMQPLQGLRRVFDSLVPEDAFWDTRWSSPQDWEHATARELGPRACETLTEPRTLQRGVMDATVVKRMVDEHRRDPVRHDRKLMLLFALELWHRTFVD